MRVWLKNQNGMRFFQPVIVLNFFFRPMIYFRISLTKMMNRTDQRPKPPSMQLSFPGQDMRGLMFRFDARIATTHTTSGNLVYTSCATSSHIPISLQQQQTTLSLLSSLLVFSFIAITSTG
jgi:hypothetical protein